MYVRELSSALARAGVGCDVYTRACEAGLPDIVEVEPGFRVHNVLAGPPAAVAKEQLPELVGEFTAGVRRRLETAADTPLWTTIVVSPAVRRRVSRLAPGP